MKINTLKTAIFGAIAMLWILPTYGASGDYIQTIQDGQNGMVGISMSLDSENNVYVLLQSGSQVCQSGGGGGFSCSWVWDTGTGKTIVKVYQKVINKTTSSSESYRSINQWIQEFTQSNVWAFSNYIFLLIFEYILFFGALIYGLYYGFRFFKDKK